MAEHAKQIKAKYLVINAPSSYNKIIGKQAFNQLVTRLSTLYLFLKYLFLQTGWNHPRRPRSRQEMLCRKSKVEKILNSRREKQNCGPNYQATISGSKRWRRSSLEGREDKKMK